MKTETLKDLKTFLDTLTDKQLEQKFRIVMDEESYIPEEPVIITEEIYVNNYDEDDYGTLETLKKIHGNIDMSDYYESNQKGMIYFPID